MAESKTQKLDTNAVGGVLSRRELPRAADPTVAILPSREDDIRFLEENNAWGFVRIGQDPESYTGSILSHQALSERLRRGHGALVSRYVDSAESFHDVSISQENES